MVSQASYSDEDDDGLEQDTIVVGVADDVYSACFLITVHGLQQRNPGKILVAWMWVATTVAVVNIMAYRAHTYQNGPALEHMAQNRTMSAMTHRLREVLQNNTPLCFEHGQHRDPPPECQGWVGVDKRIAQRCGAQPSLELLLVVQFLWAGRMLGQMSQVRTLMLTFATCPVQQLRELTIVEKDASVCVTSLLPFDNFFFTICLALPKAATAAAVWYIGVESLALSEDIEDVFFRIVVWHWITQMESLVFHSFLSHSKKAWIERAEVLQRRSRFMRFFLSWPGEWFKFITALLMLYASYYLFRTEAKFRNACFDCVHDCYSECSHSFDYCEANENADLPADWLPLPTISFPPSVLQLPSAS